MKVIKIGIFALNDSSMFILSILKQSYRNMIENAVTSHLSHQYSNTKTIIIKYPNLQDRQTDRPNIEYFPPLKLTL